MGVVTQQAKHDKVSIKTIETVADVRIVVWLSLGKADIFHDFVLALAGNFMPGKNYLYIAPVRVLAYLFVYKVA